MSENIIEIREMLRLILQFVIGYLIVKIWSNHVR